MDTVGSGGSLLPALLDGRSEVLEDADCAFPVNASVSDGDTLLEGSRTLGRDLLVALVDVGLDHDTDNASLAVADLVSNVAGDNGLVAVVLARVACVVSKR